MTSRELDDAYAERRYIRDLLVRNPKDSTVVTQFKVNDIKIGELEQAEKIGKYQVKHN